MRGIAKTDRLPVLLVSVAMLTMLSFSDNAADATSAVRSPAYNEADGTNWQAFGRTYSETHFSPLKEVNDGNVERLGLVWAHDLEPTFNSFSAPLAEDGVLYFATGYSVIHAMDARTGELLWKYDPEVYKHAGHKMRAGWGIRGIAFDNGKVFTGTLDGRLIALDAKTGALLWSELTLDPKDESYITGPPWVFNGKVVIGSGGSDYGPVRGYVTAYDQKTGKQAWRFHTVPGNPADGFENKAMEMAAKTWTGEWWKHGGGGSVWHAMAFDPKFNRIYLGVGNGAPWNQKIRSPQGGDNLFLASIVALDADTGEYVWHYQANPGETWDYNNTMDIQLADLKIGGKVRPVIIHAPKNGFFYVIDRKTGKLVSAEKFSKVTWAERIDLKTGRPVETPDARYPDGKPVIIYPFPNGAHGVQAMAFSPQTGLAYIPANEGGRVYVDAPADLSKWRHRPGMYINTGLGAPPPGMTVPPPISFLQAWDPVRQKEAWRVPMKGAFSGGVLTTAGNLVVQGNAEGKLVAYAANSGKPLWSFNAQNGILSNPITYTVDGRQYLTVITGWRSSYGTAPTWDYYGQKRRVLTFALNGKAVLPDDEPVEMPIADDESFVVDAEKAKIGSALYNTACIVCHGVGMIAGGAAPDLRKAGAPMAFESLAAVVRDGELMQNGMPRFEQLTDGEIEGLQHYIRQRAREALASMESGPQASPK
jgi:quinohemoprotein ethanol dehydrogenase